MLLPCSSAPAVHLFGLVVWGGMIGPRIENEAPREQQALDYLEPREFRVQINLVRPFHCS